MSTVSIIIPNFNGSTKTLALLRSLEPQLRPAHEVVIVDDGSSDESVLRIRSETVGMQSVHLIEQVNGGRSAARNRGAAASSGRFLVFLDNDIIVGKEFIERIILVHSRFPDAWITGPALQDVIECPHQDFLNFRQKLDFRLEGEPVSELNLSKVSSFSTQQLAVDRHLFFEVGGFDEALRDCEDFELSVRVIDSGRIILYDPSNVVWHADYADLARFVKRQIEYRRGRRILARRLPSLVRRFPEVFQITEPRSFWVYGLRRLFVLNGIWLAVVRSRAFGFLPKQFRHKIYDLLISSSSLLADDGLKD